MTQKSYLDRFDLSVGLSCNNRCVMCLENGGEVFYELKKLSQYFLLMKKAREQWFENISFVNWEPTTNPLLPKLLYLAQSIWFKKLSINTNWSNIWLRLEFAEKLMKNWLNNIVFSLHWDHNMHDKVTQTKWSFDKLIQWIRHVSSLRKQYPITICTSFVITKQNYDWLIDLAKYLYENNLHKSIDIFSVYYINYDGRSIKNLDMLAISYKQAVQSYVSFLKHPLSKYFNPNIVNIPFCKIDTDYTSYFSPSRKFYFDPNVTQEEKFFISKDQVSACHKCFYNNQCEWVYKKYESLFPDDIIVPLEKSTEFNLFE